LVPTDFWALPAGTLSLFLSFTVKETFIFSPSAVSAAVDDVIKSLAISDTSSSSLSLLLLSSLLSSSSSSSDSILRRVLGSMEEEAEEEEQEQEEQEEEDVIDGDDDEDDDGGDEDEGFFKLARYAKDETTFRAEGSGIASP
jgi:hypothetical protein